MSYPNIKFRIRQNGTGTVLATVQLGRDDSGNPIPAEWSAKEDQYLAKIEVRVLVTHEAASPSNPEHAAAESRRRVVESMAQLKSDLKLYPISVRTMARGYAYIPNIHNNFGDLVLETLSGVAVLLDNCVAESVQIVDDESRTSGIVYSVVFVRPAAHQTAG